jgi:hypothetical protein
MGEWKREEFSEKDGERLEEIAEKVADFMHGEIQKLGFNERKKILTHYLIIRTLAQATNDAMDAAGMKLRIH